MRSLFGQRLRDNLDELSSRKLLKIEQEIASPQSTHVHLRALGERDLLNMCANNYLGLANHPALLRAAHSGLERHGFGMSSVRFICGTHSVHRALEERISSYLRTEDTILFGSCFDANTGLFEALLDTDDAVISDSLNHASIIDGIRLCKAKRYRIANNNMNELEHALREASHSRTVLVVTDGVFSMDGAAANLPGICELAKRYGALVMVDDSHAVGFVGPEGRGTPALYGLEDQIDILTGTLGKALGGASGGYVSGRSEIISWLRQRARPYLFSNSLMPAICEASLTAIDLAESADDLRQNLSARTGQLRQGLSGLGFQLLGNDHPIVPVMTGDAAVAVQIAEFLRAHGILVVPFSYPVVPEGAARIRMQVSAAHSADDIERVIAAFRSAKSDLNKPTVTREL
ncbi:MULTISPECIES: glycine C-acetyltransferase [unclassified Bradyrhizobium]|uniref:glycine C-acetyltransferase n=1 Tax=unclassified Bradyrhizobium TaxID=2631580 RepID=UPI001FFAAFF1|nr:MULTISPECIES: glycine C-acetyltransferase [unclassified Bradyrhizobium]MCK1538841.1 glycine C-acetyltransferase [Bradyrhizobium sp. 176]MCK1554828.1 glycine C-acetyltransferase [Bradyrhizobium sp. 171]